MASIQKSIRLPEEAIKDIESLAQNTGVRLETVVQSRPHGQRQVDLPPLVAEATGHL